MSLAKQATPKEFHSTGAQGKGLSDLLCRASRDNQISHLPLAPSEGQKILRRGFGKSQKCTFHRSDQSLRIRRFLKDVIDAQAHRIDRRRHVHECADQYDGMPTKGTEGCDQIEALYTGGF